MNATPVFHGLSLMIVLCAKALWIRRPWHCGLKVHVNFIDPFSVFILKTGQKC